MTDISRRTLLKIGGLAAASVAGSTALFGCAPSTGGGSSASGAEQLATTNTAGHERKGLPSFLSAPEEITDFIEERDYDVVVVGAGAAGVPAAFSALEAGASVALLQKQSVALSQGGASAGIVYEESDPAAVELWVSQYIEGNQHRSKRELVDVWAKYSGEAHRWMLDKILPEGAMVTDVGAALQTGVPEGIVLTGLSFGPKPYTQDDGIKILADLAEKAGVEIFYSTPAQQLVQDESGKVTGVIAEGPEGYIKFNASKGVIMATGDYQNDEEMSNYYLPDLKHFTRKQLGKTGDGHKMILWAGGQMENFGHTKMLHDLDSGPAMMSFIPFMVVNQAGKRFANEATTTMETLNNYLRSEEDAGVYIQVFDSNFESFPHPMNFTTAEGLKAYMPEEDESYHVGVYSDLINTYKADTLEELAEKLGINDVETFKQSVARFNEHAANGKDVDFGLDPQYLQPIDTPPYYGTRRWLRVSAICSGVEVNGNHECLTPDGKVIENLYAIGNCSGGFYGGVDYPFTIGGISLGRCHAEGYYVGRLVASK